jgi:hypothetical protein
MYHSLNNNYNDNGVNAIEIENDIESQKSCVICFETDNREIINVNNIQKKFKKCACTGYVHKECITKWYDKKKHIKCIICNTSIIKINPVVVRPQHNRTTNHLSCKLMSFTIIVTAIIIIAIFYPDVFKEPIPANNNEGHDPTYLQSIMVGIY